MNYNCGSLLRSQWKHRKAFKFYRKASRLNKDYLNRDYFWNELGGMAWLTKHYKTSASFYRRSINIKDLPITKALLADALMYCGNYEEAEKMLIEANPNLPDPIDLQWHIKKIALEHLRKITGINQQIRNTDHDDSIFETIKVDSVTLGRQKCLNILKEDALCPLAWFNLGGFQVREGNMNDALKSYLLSALILPNDYVAWTNAFTLALNTSEFMMSTSILTTAYVINGEKFLRHLTCMIPDEKNEFYQKISEILKLLPANRNEFVLRFHGQDKSYDEIIKIIE